MQTGKSYPEKFINAFYKIENLFHFDLSHCDIPNTALSVGLKVDFEALPPEVVAAITSGSVDLNDPATTLALLKLNAVVGVKGTFDGTGALNAIIVIYLIKDIVNARPAERRSDGVNGETFEEFKRFQDYSNLRHLNRSQ